MIDVMKFVIDQMVSPFVQELMSIEYDKKKIPHIGFCKFILKALGNIVRIPLFYE